MIAVCLQCDVRWEADFSKVWPVCPCCATYAQEDRRKNVTCMLSPLLLVQERLKRGVFYPWRVLVACSLCNLTPGERAWPVLAEILRRWPEPRFLAVAPLRELRRLLGPLGLHRRRALGLRYLSLDYIGCPPADSTDVPRLYGCGTYAQHAYAIFVEGRLVSNPADGHLRKYVNWKRRAR